MKPTVFFIDPQGQSGSLGKYDYELLSRVKNCNLYYFGGKTFDYNLSNNCKCYLWFNYSSYGNTIIKGLSYIFTMIRILVLIIAVRPKVVHMQWIRLPFFDYLYYIFIKKFFKTRIVYTVHNLLPHKIKKGDFTTYKKFYELSDNLIVHTNTAKSELSVKFKIDTKKIHVAPHGPLKFEESEEIINNEVANIDLKYNLKNKVVFSILGTQSEYKGTDLLVKAWLDSKKLRSNPHIVLVVAGKNADCFVKSNHNSNIISIDGLLSDLTFNALIRRSDVIILPYRRIEQSGVLLSFISEHVPYCTTDIGELSIPIKQENIGWIIPEVSSESIRETIEYIMDDPEGIKDKAHNIHGWQCVCKYYDWDKSAKVTEDIYQS